MNTARRWPYAGTSGDTSVIVSDGVGGRIRSGTSTPMAASGRGPTGPTSTGGCCPTATAHSGCSQWWNLVPATTAGYHRLVNVGNGWCVDIEGGSTANGAGVVQRPVSGEPSQEWQIVEA
jgi:hypothetical protein